MHQPSYFLAEIDNRRRDDRPGVPVRLSKLLRWGESIVSVSADAFGCHFLLSPTARFARHTDEADVLIVLHGELYPDLTRNAAQQCLEAYLRQDLDFLSSLHGSFAMAIVDASQDRIRFVTDPVNSRKLFCGRQDGMVWISTLHALDRHPIGGKPDPAGIAHCLVNGWPVNGRTPFEGLRVLDPASVHEISPARIVSNTYWEYRPESRMGRTLNGLKADLRDTLLAAVERRRPAQGSVELSLSGGYDSTAILGALGRLETPDVSCFTYRKPGESEPSDTSVARQAAAVLGYRHDVIPAYADDLATVIADNVQRGHGMTRLVVETDAWRLLRRHSQLDRPRTIWVGEEYYGMVPAYTLRDDRDVLDALGIYDLKRLGPVRSVFPRRTAASLQEAMTEDLRLLLARASSLRDDLYGMRDYLYVDQRLQRVLSWREAFAGTCGEVRNPLLDREILEFTQCLPRRLRLGKRFFKDVVRDLFPDLFAIDRAAGGDWFAGAWIETALRDEADLLKSLLRDRPCVLDSIIPPHALVRLIESEVEPRKSSIGRARFKIRRKSDQARRRVRALAYPTAAAGPPKRRPVSSPVFIMRAILLRELFRAKGAAGGGSEPLV